MFPKHVCLYMRTYVCTYTLALINSPVNCLRSLFHMRGVMGSSVRGVLGSLIRGAVCACIVLQTDPT